jgi:adenosylmethionine-8-amino-7-oxononanoate aminotransferase
MCGMGRTGYMHAWQKEDVVPDIQVLGKGIGNGFPMSAILIGKEVHKVFKEGTGEFAHGHTYQNHPLACAHGLAVLRIIKEDKLVDNVKNMGALLARLLHAELGNHKNVGDIRGEGLFWAVSIRLYMSRASLIYPALLC